MRSSHFFPGPDYNEEFWQGNLEETITNLIDIFETIHHTGTILFGDKYFIEKYN